jgi:hypothetical protein
MRSMRAGCMACAFDASRGVFQIWKSPLRVELK